MSAVTYTAIKRAIASLHDATHIVVEYDGVAVELDGRNSPYRSHQRVLFRRLAEDERPRAGWTRGQTIT